MSVQELTFTAPLWLHDGGVWLLVTVPEDVSADVRLFGGPPRGFGSVRVEVTVGRTTWRTSVFPDGPRFVLPVKKAVRTAEHIDVGDPLAIVLRVLGD
ncbi:DUF1905 domain-containing protein [Nocardioides sp.]|uniref:DUF1905 domain-containing protein n=1 Tax=Nocardioides sp. TaxID=35761 RepID=UPI002B279281|nr:DUF1905 domain-containing protein [Nocardioides sp.]